MSVRKDIVNTDLRINGKQAGQTIKDLTKRVKLLNKELNHLTPGTEEYKRKLSQLRQSQKVLDTHRKRIRGISGIWGTLTKEVKQFGLIAIAAFGGTAIIQGISNLIKQNARLDDSFSDVIKTTDLTKKEVKQLNKEFKGFNTRTARKDLRDLARIAGKLGERGIEPIKKFVREADKIVVALKEDLGGNVEQTIRKLGKLVDIFGIRKKFGLSEGMNKVGSSINALGAASTANEQFIVNFTTRLGGIAPNAKISIQDVMGLGAAIDVLGVSNEIATTALGKLLVAIGEDVPHFAKIAGMETKDFSRILQEDANEALLMVLEGAKSTEGGLVGLAETLEVIGIDSARAAQVVGVLSNNIELVREQQALSNQEFEKGTSLTEEFDKKNSNLAAKLAKIQKWIAGIFVNPAVMSGISFMVSKFAEWIDPVNRLSDGFKEQRNKVESLEKDTIPLLKKYEELKLEAIENTAKQEELKKVFEKLKKVVPGVSMVFDEHGKIIDINSEKVQHYIDQQKKILELQTQEEYDKIRKNLHELFMEYKHLAWILNQLEETGTVKGPSGQTKYDTDDLDAFVLKHEEAKNKLIEQLHLIEEIGRDVDPDDFLLNKFGEVMNGITKFGVDYTQTIGEIIEATGFITQEELSKDLEVVNEEEEKKQIDLRKATLEELMQINSEAALAEINRRKKVSAEYKAQQEKEAQEQLERLTKVNDKILKLREDLDLKRLDADERELQGVRNKYDALIREAKGFDEKIKELEQLRNTELQLIQDKHAKRDLKNIQDFQESLRLELMDDYDKEIVLAMQHYEELLDLADQYGIDATDIREKLNERIAEIDAKHREKEKEETEQHTQKMLDLRQQEFELFLDVSKASLDLFNEINTTHLNNELNTIETARQAELDSLSESNNSKEAIERQYQVEAAAIKLAIAQTDDAQAKKKLNKELKELQLSKARQLKFALDTAEHKQEINDKYDRQAEEARRVAANNLKTIQTAEAIINTAAAVAQINAHPVVNSDISQVLRTTLTALVSGIGLAQVAKIQSQKLAEGGNTANIAQNTFIEVDQYQARLIDSFQEGGLFSEPTFGLIAEKGAEEVYPNWMITEPKLVPVFDMLNDIRHLKFIPFADGGNTTTTASNIFPSSVTQDAENTDRSIPSELPEILLMIGEMLYNLNEHLEDPKPVQAFLDYDHFVEKTQEIEDAISDGKI